MPGRALQAEGVARAKRGDEARSRRRQTLGCLMGIISQGGESALLTALGETGKT